MRCALTIAEVLFGGCVEFARACEQSTDFHFASLEHQFETINECLVNARDTRLRIKPATDADSDKLSAMSSTSSASDEVSTTALPAFSVYFTDDPQFDAFSALTLLVGRQKGHPT